ncbi:hypothetical protein [Furfurilactobacillus entadae]|uniref:hypothetical protein n=1 Tax=Furfurilactobacillus entadae TaxID=2922307 RepID=UPI0035E72613
MEITNVEEFLPALKSVLRGSYSDDHALVGGVLNRLQESNTLHYEVTRWRANDSLDHEFTFKQDEHGNYTYVYNR